MNNTPTEDDPSLRRLQKARIDFLFKNPFLSVLALSVPMEEDPEAKNSFETDGTRIFLNSRSASEQSDRELQSLYAHSLLHIALRHAPRRNGRDLQKWNQACDIAVELLLAEMEGGYALHENDLDHLQGFAGLPAEEIYSLLPEPEENKDGEEKGERGEEPDLRDPPEDDPQAEQFLSEELDALLLQARAASSKSSGLPAALLKEIDTVTQVNYDLVDLIRDHLVSSLFETTADYRRPSRRTAHLGIYLPGMVRSQDRLDAIVAIDSSASVSTDLYRKFLGVIERTCREFYEFTLTILPFDEGVQLDARVTLDSFEGFDPGSFRIPKSDGGTNLTPLLDYLDTLATLPRLLVVITDGRFEMERKSPVHTIFLITEESRMERFYGYGRVIRAEL